MGLWFSWNNSCWTETLQSGWGGSQALGLSEQLKEIIQVHFASIWTVCLYIYTASFSSSYKVLTLYWFMCNARSKLETNFLDLKIYFMKDGFNCLLISLKMLNRNDPYSNCSYWDYFKAKFFHVFIFLLKKFSVHFQRKVFYLINAWV